VSLRPSSLPKLAQCAKWESEAIAGPAADRGNALDLEFRLRLGNPSVVRPRLEDLDDESSVQWAVDTARVFSGGRHVETNEENLRIAYAGMTGTADALCSERQWSADLKTGEVRNYVGQQAAYALGFMDREFTDHWTVLLLFCDERQVVTLDFTREQAERIVREIIAKAKDTNAVPTPCDYCGWCALRWTCKPRLEPLSQLLCGAPDKLDVERIKADPAAVGALLSITHEIQREDGLHDVLKAAALDHINSGRTVSGFVKVAGRESRTVDNVTVARWTGEFGIGPVTAAYGAMSEKKFLALWNKHFPGKPLPEDAVKTNHGPAYLSKSRSKAK
jgi:hypothetical protein